MKPDLPKADANTKDIASTSGWDKVYNEDWDGEIDEEEKQKREENEEEEEERRRREAEALLSIFSVVFSSSSATSSSSSFLPEEEQEEEIPFVEFPVPQRPAEDWDREIEEEEEERKRREEEDSKPFPLQDDRLHCS